MADAESVCSSYFLCHPQDITIIMKTILVPTDFSIDADYAIHYALNLIAYYEASIILYHAFIPFESGFYPPDQSKKENLETENTLLRRLSHIQDTFVKTNKTNKKISVSIHVDRGPASIRLPEFCMKKKIDLIVMGTTGASGIKEVLIGSFTADIMTKAPCPVLAIPKNYKFKIPEKITFASDYNTNDVRAIKFLADLNKSFNAQICILHIDENHYTSLLDEKSFTKFKQKTEARCKGIPLSFQHMAAQDAASIIVLKMVEDKTDILAMSPVKREGIWDCLMNKSVTRTVAHHLPIPLLSIPGKKH